MTAHAPKDRPIIFSAPMVRALLDGRKSQTRRVLKPQPAARTACVEPHPEYREEWRAFADGEPLHSFCLPYVPGDRLWVREAWCYGPAGQFADAPIYYRATDNDVEGCTGYTKGGDRRSPWRPSIHMPRWASRLTLIVTDVRVQRLQDISEEDAQAEGALKMRCEIDDKPHFYNDAERGTHKIGFAGIWAHINGAESWDADPWVVAVSFKTIRANIDSAEAKAA